MDKVTPRTPDEWADCMAEFIPCDSDTPGQAFQRMRDGFVFLANCMIREIEKAQHPKRIMCMHPRAERVFASSNDVAWCPYCGALFSNNMWRGPECPG